MPYLHYRQNIPARMAENQIWYNVVDLVEIINIIKKSNLQTSAGRTTSMDALNSATTKPFNANTRFPEYEVFVCEDQGDWRTKFTQLRSALSFKDPGDIGKHSEDVNNTHFLSAQAAAYSAVNMCNKILAQLAAQHKFVARELFEEEFHLTWNDGLNPNASAPGSPAPAAPGQRLNL